MALIKCPECAGTVSDRAPMCPHCGFPMKQLPPPKVPAARRNRMKLPKKYGSVYKLSGYRSRPWMAIFTKGWEIDTAAQTSKQKRVPIGYFKTENEALVALAEYNKNPYDIQRNAITFEQVYELWSEEYYASLKNESSSRSYKAAYKYCDKLYKMRILDIRVEHMKGAINDCSAGPSTKSRIKSLFNLMYGYAMLHEIVQKNYAALFSQEAADSEIDRVPYSWDEIQVLWKNIDIPYVDTILFSIYSGCRPMEVFTINPDDVHLNEGYLIGGSKTESGIDRVIPIHPDIRDIVNQKYRESKENGWPYLFMNNEYNKGNFVPMTYDSYKGRFKRIMQSTKMNHHPGDGRHTFITCAKERSMDQWILKLVVGHAIDDVTEKTYTHRKIRQLCSAVSKLDFSPINFDDESDSL